MSIVRELYAVIPDSVEDYVTVRGVRFLFNGTTINEFLEILVPEVDRYAEICLMELTERRAEGMRQKLQNGPNEEGWNIINDEYISIRRRTLDAASRVWFYFIVHNIMPSRHHDHVRKDVVFLLYAIVTGMRINIGNLLHAMIKQSAASDKYSFWFPSLITMMCKDAGVPTRLDDEPLEIEQPLDYKWWKRVTKPTGNIPVPVSSSRAHHLGASSSSQAPVTTLSSLEARFTRLELEQARFAQDQADHIAYSEHSYQTMHDMLRYMGTSQGFDMSTYPGIPSWNDFRQGRHAPTGDERHDDDDDDDATAEEPDGDEAIDDEEDDH